MPTLPFERYLDFADDCLQDEGGTPTARAAWRNSLARTIETAVREWFEDHPRSDELPRQWKGREK